jgi:outer membrane biosynthesis protein TonB
LETIIRRRPWGQELFFPNSERDANLIFPSFLLALGVDYLTLVEQRESQIALKQCLKVALVDVAALQEKVNEHYDKLEVVEPKKREVRRPDGAGVIKSARNTPVAVEEKSEAEAVPAPKPKKKKVKKPNGDYPETVDSDVEKKKSTKKKKSSKKKKKTGGEDGQGKKSTSENEE